MTIPGTSLVKIPLTGEAVALTAPTDQLAEAVAQIAALQDQLKEARADLRDELIRRLDHENLRSVRAGAWEIKASAPAREFDADALAVLLAELAEAGKVSQAAADACLPLKVERKPAVREIRKLASTLGLTHPDDAKRLLALERPAAAARTLKVESA